MVALVQFSSFSTLASTATACHGCCFRWCAAWPPPSPSHRPNRRAAWPPPSLVPRPYRCGALATAPAGAPPHSALPSCTCGGHQALLSPLTTLRCCSPTPG